MRLLERWSARQQGYYEGMASGAAVLMTFGADDKREKSIQNLFAAAQQAYATNGVVFACVLARMMLLAEATFKLRSLVDKRLYGTEDLRILEYPWPNGTTGDLIARLEQDSSQEGNAYLVKAGPDRLVRLPPGEVTIVSTEFTTPVGRFKEVVGYDWDPELAAQATGSKATAQFFTVDEVAHFAPIPDPLAKVRGMSWLTPVLKEVTADSGMTQYKTSRTWIMARRSRRSATPRSSALTPRTSCRSGSWPSSAGWRTPGGRSCSTRAPTRSSGRR